MSLPASAAALLVTAHAAGAAALLTVLAPAGPVASVVLFGAGFGVMTSARPALLGDLVPAGRFAGASGRQALATTVGRVAVPVAAGATVTAAGYPGGLAGVAGCCLAAASAPVLVGGEGT